MTPEVAVAERLGDLAGVTALVSTRIYQFKVRQGSAWPVVRVQIVGETTQYHLRGEVGVYRTRVQVDAFAEETSGGDPYAGATALASAIHGDGAGSGLSAWVGAIGDLLISSCQRIDRDVMYDAEERRLVRCRQDYMLWWRPA